MSSSIIRPNQDLGWLRGDAELLDTKLRTGDGLGWPGDPRLSLVQGVVEATKRTQHPVTGKWLRAGDIVARRWEVWRECEDGEDRRIGHWRMEEFDRILLDLSGMRLDSPGHVDTLDTIDKHNAAKEDEEMRPFRDNLGEALDRGHRLVHELREGKNTFAQVGKALAEKPATPEPSAPKPVTAP